MQAVVLVIALGIAIFLVGAWFNVGMFMSSSTPILPLTWEMFVVAMTINGIGTGLIVYGNSIRKSTHALNTAYKNKRHGKALLVINSL